MNNYSNPVTVTGNPASFEASGNGKLLSLSVPFSPIQDLHGYDKPWSGGNGKNKLPNDTGTTTLNGVSFIKQPDGSVLVNGTASADISYDYYRNLTKLPTGIEAGGSYILSNNIAPTPCSIEAYCSTNGTSFQYVTGLNMATSLNFTVPTGAVGFLMRIKISQGNTASNMTFKPMIRLATETDATFVPYSNICPISGRTGLSVYVGPTQDQQDATTYAVDWTDEAGTVYGGTDEVVGGVLTDEWAEIPSYNGETITEPWLSSMDAYTPGATPTTGAQVVYKLATPLTYQLTAQEIEVLVGENNVWTSSGPVSVTVEAPFVGTVTNPTPFEARPMLEVSGVGEITINGKSIQILESVSDFQIDCEAMEAEDNSKIYCMDFPYLECGENEIVGDGSITALTVTPRWWTL